ncbi:MAG: carboxypeptidase regulatory-like domain-containing protein [Xanthomonadales bacterium]|nr:carboxypeptidase regulatory-like domain-containing protein [Xanthomonadales bacterium]
MFRLRGLCCVLLLATCCTGHASGIDDELRFERAIDRQLAEAAATGTAQRKKYPEAPSRASQGAGRIHGVVHDVDTGLPVADAELRLHPFGRVDFLSNPSVRTDAAGAFEFTGLAPGYYYVSASGIVGNQQPYQAEVYPDVSCGPACDAVRSGRMLPVGLGPGPDALSIELDRGASVSGTLSSAPDKPMRLGFVVIYDEQRMGVTTAIGRAEAGSASSVSYRVDGLPPGKYYAAIRARTPVGVSGYSFVARSPSGDACGLGACMQESDSFMLSYGEQVSDFDFSLTAFPGAPISLYGVRVPDGSQDDLYSSLTFYSPSGQLTGWTSESSLTFGSPDYLAMRASYVFLTRSGSDRVVAAYSDRVVGSGFRYYRGRVFPDIDCGPLVCDPSPGDAVPGGTVADLTPAGSLNGTVHDRQLGRSLPGVLVSAHAPDGTLMAQGVSNADGDYVIPSLPDGSYRVSTANAFGLTDGAWPNVRCNGDCAPDQGELVALAGAADVTQIDLVVGGGFFVGGFE